MSKRLEAIDINSIIRILPNKPPAIFVDRVTKVKPGAQITAIKNITATEPCFAGHFPGLPILPVSTLIDIMLQTCCLLAYATEQYNPDCNIVSLRGIKKAKFHRSVFPGDSLEIESNFLSRRTNIWRFEITVYKGDKTVAEAELALSFHDRDGIL
ncbi:MAG: 3-hydroxyacyl-ACP dehydratase FabZ [Proteobacteria bacterium]|nr:3-hydroxyacyl-ACP dehydratase FabZ [Pseudomonadota bacterium]